jgi:spore coat protein JB
MDRPNGEGGIKMYQEQLEMLKQIQTLEFTAVDFNLYLDTHPDDQRALSDYTNTVAGLQRLRATYIRCAGPLTPTDPSGSNRWNWIAEPWPWQIEY